jgi:hypothetical protein
MLAHHAIEDSLLYATEALGHLEDVLIEAPDETTETWGDPANWPVGGWWDTERPRLGRPMCRAEMFDPLPGDVNDHPF